MNKESVQTNGGEDRGVSSAMRINNLSYRVPPQTNVVNKRSLIKHYFTKNEYSAGEPAVCVLSSGDQYISGRNSYLVFKVRATSDSSGASPATVPASFGTGSALNVINRVTFHTESGVEVERQEDANLKARDWDYWRHPRDMLDDYGSVIGYTPSYETAEIKANTDLAAASSVAFPLDVATVTVGGEDIVDGVKIMRKGKPRDLADWANINDGKVASYCIPLSHLLGVFDQEQMLPGLGFCGGARLEFSLENAQTALKWASSIGTNTYKVYDISIMLDSFQLSDAVLSTLNRQSASTALEVSYWAYDRQQDTLAGARVGNFDAKRAVSRASLAWAKTRLTDNTQQDVKDCFASEKFQVVSQSWQLAGVFLPNNPLTARGDAKYLDVSEQFYNALYVLGKNAGVNLRDFKGTEPDGTTDAEDGKGIQTVLLDRNLDGGQSGYPLSGSRILQLRTEYADQQNRTIHMFVKYMKVCKVFLDRAIVQE